MPRPRTLSKPEFMQLQRSKGIANPNYGKYRSFLAQRRGQAAARPADPFAPTPEPQLRSQITSGVRSQIDPILEEIRRGIETQTKAGMGAITGYSSRLAEALEGHAGRADQPYRAAAGKSADVNAALLQALQGGGSDLAAGLSERLQSAGMPDNAVSQVSGEVAQTGQGSGAAVYGIGSATMNELLSRGATAASFAGKLPGIARTQGLQDARGLQSQMGNRLADETGRVTSQVPGLIEALMGDARAQELRKAELSETFGITRQELGLKRESAAPKPSAALSKVYGYVVDETGTPILRNGKPIPVAASKGKTPKAKAADEAKARATRRREAFDGAVGMARDAASRTKEALNSFDEPVEAADPIPYSEARAQIMTYLSEQLPWMSQKQRRALAEKALATAGYKRLAATAAATAGDYGYPGSGVGGNAGP